MSQSRLALFCEKFIQAGWLAALIVAPLFFNIYSSRVFEPDKIALIRTLALAMGAAWLVLRAERWQPRGGRGVQPAESFAARFKGWLRRISAENPLSIPALLLLFAYVISTALSVSPTVSFFGSYQRLQGLYTFSAYLVIFFLAASQIRTRADVERAVSIALIASFPIALYGIIQHYFLDPLPWVGDVTTRVASNLGNSIFIGAFLIMTVPLALLRLIRAGERVSAEGAPSSRRWLIPAAVLATVLAFAAAWGLSFDLTAKEIVEANYTGTLTPEQLSAAAGAFNLALAASLVVVLVWWGAALLLKRRAANFLLIACYSAVLAVQLLALVFSQSRGPLIGLLGGLFVFGVLVALVRGVRWLALGAVGLAAVVMLLLALINLPSTPLSALRDLPYVGRLGRVFELEGGSGRVRVLIWQGALQLALPHSPLWAPTTGDDAWNPIRPLVGYGPETMYVAYNRFYPPELGRIESRNATPDRSHNETFDALVTTGLFGFAAENVVFLIVFYFALKWLGLVPSARARNLFVALWFGGGLVSALAFGATLGWHFIGVALPGGMMLGLFAYLIGFALRPAARTYTPPPDALWYIALIAMFAAHFIEIHFGIAIVTTRLYFWFFAAVLVALGSQRLASAEPNVVSVTAEAKPSEPKPVAPPPTGRAKPKHPRSAPVPAAAAPAKPRPARGQVSAAPLITIAILVGFILAIMGYDYINTNNAAALGDTSVSGVGVVLSALTIKNTTAGSMGSPAMLWLLLLTLAVGMSVGIGEWGYRFRLGARDWGIAALLFVVLAAAVFSGLAFYHVLLITTPSAALLDALTSAVVLFTLFMLLVATLAAVTLAFDEPLPAVWVRRTTNWVVTPVLMVVAAILILASNVDPVRADMLYKQGASLTGQNNAASVTLFQRALALQPQQDYYMLFLGRAYLDEAKSTTDMTVRKDDLTEAQDTLLHAREINPYNTDHSANLARLAQAEGTLLGTPAARLAAYKQADEYFGQATRLSPNTAHLYDQHAQALLEYAALLDEQKDTASAAAVRAEANEQIAHALNVDNTFCLTYAVRATAQSDWQSQLDDALKAVQLAPQCGDVFFSEGLGIAVRAMASAGDAAVSAGQAAQFESALQAAASEHPSLEAFTTLANFYSKAGRIPDAIRAVDSALAQIPASDTTTRKRYEDFKFTLQELQSASEAAQAAPQDVEKQRALANQWLARGQFDFALPVFQKVAQLAPNDYAAQRQIALLLLAQNRLDDAAKQIVTAQSLAPAADQPLWQSLGKVITSIRQGNSTQAAAILQELAKQADSKDYALVSALRALAVQLQGAG